MAVARLARVSFRAQARAPEWTTVADRTESEMVWPNDLEMCPVSYYAQDNVWKRLRLKAKQTRHHSPAAAAVPRKEN
jgi:hypothetical protein